MVRYLLLPALRNTISFFKPKGFSYDRSRPKKNVFVSQTEKEEETLTALCLILLLLPEKYEIDKDTLIQLWMAGDYIKEDESIELTGDEYFDRAVKKGYLSLSGTDFMTGKNKYRVDIKNINRLKYMNRASSYLKWDDQNEEKGMQDDTESIQHLSLVCSEIDKSISQTLKKLKKLRTLLVLASCHKVLRIPDNLLTSLNKLQALDLSRTRLEELPSSIGHMVELRYLDVSWTLIKWLPDIICSLVELQTLKLRGCSNLRELPEDLKNLTKLQHLDVDVLRQLEIMPKGIAALVNLQTLSAFLVGTEDGTKIQELKKLNNLSGKLCIAKLEHVENEADASNAWLDKKEQLEKLELRWTASEISGTHHNSEAILKYLKPCTSLKELQILCYEGMTFPSWISNPEFNSLVHILFYKCESLSKLPPLEQLRHLKHLELVKINSVQRIELRARPHGKEVAFPKLEKLEINEMLKLRVWDWKKQNSGDFKSLTHLIIDGCPELQEFDVFPHISSIEEFEYTACPKLPSPSEMKLPDFLKQTGEGCYKVKLVSVDIIQQENEDEE